MLKLGMRFTYAPFPVPSHAQQAAQARTNKKAAAAGVSVLAGKGGIQGGAPGGMMGRGARPAGPAVGLGLGGPGGMGMSLNAAATGPTYGLDIDMPALLKKYLVEDYECVSEDGKLVPLPRTPCIREIMEKYVAEVRRAPAQQHPWKAVRLQGCLRSSRAGMQDWKRECLEQSKQKGGGGGGGLLARALSLDEGPRAAHSS